MKATHIFCGLSVLLAVWIGIVQPTCVLESDFGFKINCAFKKSGLFRVRNLGGIKAHASLGFSLGDELGFEQSLTNLDPSRRRSVSIKNGVPANVVLDTSARPTPKQEKRGKQNRIMMRPMAPVPRPNQAAMDKLTSLHRRGSSTMKPIIVTGPTLEAPTTLNRVNTPIVLAKPVPMAVPPFRPLPPKDDLKVLPISSPTRKIYTPLQVPQSKGPGLMYQNTVPHQVHDLASMYPGYNTKKVDDYNTITGYGDDTTLKFNKDDINAKIAEIAKAGNISMEAVEAAIALRQQQLLSKYANIPVPTQPTTTSTTSTTTTTEEPLVFQKEPEPEFVVATPQKPKRQPTTGKVMNAPKEYYPVGYEKNFDDHFQSKVDLPETVFHCGDQKYFPGLYGDENLGCMVFHVCALTDDGLVMKSFLCPESTLFDQTILKCNWWFYVDCKNTRRLYDTNIPVSKSYQLMKALTFFSSYKKEIQDDGQENPEDVEGIKEAITILENQDSVKAPHSNAPNDVQIVTSQPYVDERHNRQVQASTESPSPIYRANRNYNNGTKRITTRRNPSQTKETYKHSDIKLITVNSDMSVRKESESSENVKATYNNANSAENSKGVSSDGSSDRKHRRRMTLKYNNATTSTTSAPVHAAYVTTARTVEDTTPQVEIIKQDIYQISSESPERPETLTDLLASADSISPTILKEAENLPPVKRVYRSSAERETVKDDKELTVLNNEKVQIIRPTKMVKLVGEFATPTAAIAKLDEAILGKRVKKEVVTVVTPQRRDLRSSAHRHRT